MILKVCGMITSLLISIFLARNLGSEGLGVVSFANNLGMIILVFTMFGFQNVIIKFIAIAKGKLDNKNIASTLKTSIIFNGLLSILIAGLGAIVFNHIY